MVFKVLCFVCSFLVGGGGGIKVVCSTQTKGVFTLSRYMKALFEHLEKWSKNFFLFQSNNQQQQPLKRGQRMRDGQVVLFMFVITIQHTVHTHPRYYRMQ